MIQKEQIQQRRQEIAEIRHADSVFRDIEARENERQDYEKRWFWELLQNAKDSVNKEESIKVKVEISESEISFSHTGNPFELDDILSLIIQGSSKAQKEGKTGRFGTGFITTYLLSKEVRISGGLTDNQGHFDFLLNRNADTHEEFYKLQQESNNEFDSSIQENSYLGNSEFQTKFTYNLDEIGKASAKAGLQCLDELIPITQLFNNQIESVTIIERGQAKTFTKSLIREHESDGYQINEWEISTLLDNLQNKSLRAYVYHNSTFEACIITHFIDDKEFVFPLTRNYPRLYFTFPLIGTEEIGIPIIMNSTAFEPRVERDGVYLKKIAENASESSNKAIIHNALLLCTPIFAELFSSKGINDIHQLFNFSPSKDLKWIDRDWLKEVKNEVLSQLITKPVIRFYGNSEELTCLNELLIPYSNSDGDIKRLWKLLSDVKNLKVPLLSELDSWVTVTKAITKLRIEDDDPYKLDFVWGLKELIKFVEEKETLEVLKTVVSTDIHIWLNNFYSTINEISNNFPLNIKVVLNQNGKLREGEGMYWDRCSDDALITISEQIGLNFAHKFISRAIKTFHIPGIKDFTKQDGINELKEALNDLTESDFSNIDFLECNAKFLKWLIDQKLKDTVKDLKVVSGASNKNSEALVYDHFPKAEHLLLSPKHFFEDQFPLFSSLIRDKDCLNEVYDNYLEDDDYKYLAENGFIHAYPLVTKREDANLKTLELLVKNEGDLSLLRDDEGQLKYKFQITYTDFAYLTATDGYIYGRNNSQNSSLQRFRFLLKEAVEKDSNFENDEQEVLIEGLEEPLMLSQCLWVYRAKRLNWINIKSESENAETKFIKETPSSKNLSELLKGDKSLIQEIKGPKQQLFLNRLGVGVSDLIRNTLPSDELRLSWDKAITNMITSNADPELVQEIFSDTNIKKEYERRLKERKLITRNQSIGKLIEDLFKEYIDKLQEDGYSVNIKREPFGSDYIITEESSDLVNSEHQREGFKINNWLIELKATGKDHAAMTPLQAKTAAENKDNYALVVVPIDGSEPDIDYIRQNAKVISSIGYKIGNIISDFNEVESKKSDLYVGKEGISVFIEDQNIRFRVKSTIWTTEQNGIETFISSKFSKSKTVV